VVVPSVPGPTSPTVLTPSSVPPGPNAFGAQMLTPAPGSTLPSGAVTFTWTDANADYFLAIETVPGAHDVFFAIVRVTTLTLGPACAPVPPTGCIPARGEPVHVKLMTKLHGVWNTGFEYSYTAASG
jgi:hypothetical protein